MDSYTCHDSIKFNGNPMKKIACIGTGYVGLVSGVMFASIGHQVICIDTDQSKIEQLSAGKCTIYEKDLEKHLSAAILNDMIKFSTSYEDIKDVSAVFICVGTPPGPDGKANLSYVIDSILEAASIISDQAIIVVKSTVTPGTCKKLEALLEEKGYKHKIASNPEFLREGSAVSDFQNPDRIIFGGDKFAFEVLHEIYKPLIDAGVKTVETDVTTSELIKHASNSFLAVKLSYINEMANLCEKIGADIETLSLGMGLDKRIGSQFLKAGPGFGGSCFPKDTLALSNLSRELGVNATVLDAAIDSNLKRYGLMKDKISSICEENKNLAILGAAFKAGTDDVRESPAVNIIELLVKDGFKLKVYDPVALENFIKLNIKNASPATSLEDACLGADAIIILTEWEEFSKMNLAKIGSIVSSKVIIDLRKVIQAEEAKKHGFKYYTIGQTNDASTNH